MELLTLIADGTKNKDGVRRRFDGKITSLIADDTTGPGAFYSYRYAGNGKPGSVLDYAGYRSLLLRAGPKPEQ